MTESLFPRRLAWTVVLGLVVLCCAILLNGSYGLRAAEPSPRDCLAIHLADVSAESGTYTIDPDGEGPIPALDAYCDMDIDWGGWTVIDYAQDPGWQKYFSSWAPINEDREATPDIAQGNPSHTFWAEWFTPAIPDTQFRISPLCQEVSPTLYYAEAYAATGNFYGCLWYNSRCDMDSDTQECSTCLDGINSWETPGKCSHMTMRSTQGNNAIYVGYVHNCSFDWWNRAPSVGIDGRHCVAYRTQYSVFVPAVER